MALRKLGSTPQRKEGTPAWRGQNKRCFAKLGSQASASHLSLCNVRLSGHIPSLTMARPDGSLPSCRETGPGKGEQQGYVPSSSQPSFPRPPANDCSFVSTRVALEGGGSMVQCGASPQAISLSRPLSTGLNRQSIPDMYHCLLQTAGSFIPHNSQHHVSLSLKCFTQILNYLAQNK